ncbi:hypothetical protein BVRB_031510 [Beta vulgaris subsp. vulgaris]|uniref:Uncharacterized protein n=1 Tax=Beta vulgaris subsp. vulgaris TaxID=3555 RepID=A0A0J8DRR5_BETVV|nr:hypothetical protein BVRB_031510 [Beta vulgaris subsp. vulgaris]
MRQRKRILRWVKRGFVVTALSSAIIYASFKFNAWATIRALAPVELERPSNK